MDNDPETVPRKVWRWATTRPQSYAVYLICLILVWVVSFYAGTMKPKHGAGMGPPQVSAPRN
jgi:hypothetical protein